MLQGRRPRRARRARGNQRQARRDPRLSNFETSPLRFQYEADMQEYRGIQSTVEMHFKHQHAIAQLSLGLITVLVGLTQASYIRLDPASYTGRIWLLILSIVFSSFGLTSLWHDTSVAILVSYARYVLAPRFKDLSIEASGSDKPVFLFDAFQRENRLRNWRVTPFELAVRAGSYALTLFPGPFLLIATFYFSGCVFCISKWETVFFITAIFAGALVFVATLYTIWLFYSKIHHKEKWIQPDAP